MAFGLLGLVAGNTTIGGAEVCIQDVSRVWRVLSDLGGQVSVLMSDSMGKLFVVTSFGESHGRLWG